MLKRISRKTGTIAAHGNKVAKITLASNHNTFFCQMNRPYKHRVVPVFTCMRCWQRCDSPSSLYFSASFSIVRPSRHVFLISLLSVPSMVYLFWAASASFISSFSSISFQSDDPQVQESQLLDHSRDMCKLSHLFVKGSIIESANRNQPLLESIYKWRLFLCLWFRIFKTHLTPEKYLWYNV